MSKAVVSYLGGVGNKENGLNLTGSCTLFEVKKGTNTELSVYIDFGLFQGTTNDNDNNKIIPEKIIGADYLILTHAHVDHSGKLPLLVKNGFKGTILMTQITKECIFLMLNDYVKLTREKIREVQEKNKKTIQNIKHHLKIKNLYEKYKKNGLSKIKKAKTKKQLESLMGDNIELYEGIYNESIKYLEERGINSESDISKNLEPIPELLYDEEDILKLMSQVHTIEIGHEEKLGRNHCIFDLNNKYIDRIPEMVANGYSKTIYVHPYIKNDVIKRWESLLKSFQGKLSENDKRIEETIKLKQELLQAFEFVTDFESGISLNEELYKKYKKLLRNNSINSIDVIHKIHPYIFTPPFTKEDIKKAKSLLVADFNVLNREIISDFKLQFLDAGHIEGSVQALISVTRQRVIKTVDGIPGNEEIDKNETNFLFSGDLGRINQPNLSGSPQVLPHRKIDFYQIDSTYAGRVHADREESKNTLFDEIKNATGKVIIPAFSMQRSQEILIILLEKIIESKKIIDEIKKLNSKIKSLKSKNIISYVEAKEIKELEEKIEELKKEIFECDIIVDGPLTEEINGVYLRNLGEKYKLLSPSVQEQIFGREIVRFLKRGEYTDLYSQKNKNKKQVIISSSGMCQGGRIMSHLINNLEEEKSTLIFTGYTPENTIGGAIKLGEDVKINGDEYKVKCRVVDLKGFSGHIDESEILDLLGRTRLTRKTIVSLNHGSESRLGLAEKVLNLLRGISNKTRVIVPEIGSSHIIKI